MSNYSYNPYDRYRQRSARRTTSIIMFMFLFAAMFGLGYWVSGIRSQQDIYILKEEKRIISEENDKIQSDMVKLRADAQTANVRLEQLKASYQEILSDGAMKDIVTLVGKQLKQGVDEKRLKSVILSARPPQNCSDPKSKRFIVITPVYKGSNSKSSIDDGVVYVSGKGKPSKNSKGQNEAWFDSGQVIEVTFKAKNRKAETKKGLLPLHHSMVIAGKEYRFTITVGEKSFAKVTFDHCDYP